MPPYRAAKSWPGCTDCVFGKSPSRDKTILAIVASSPEKTVKMLPWGE